MSEQNYTVDGLNVKRGDEVIATFKHAWDAENFARIENRDVNAIRDLGHDFLRRDYNNDVRDLAESIKGELDERIADGEEGEALREWLIEHIDETIDGCARVIYTGKAQEALLFSSNDGAYADEFGPEGMVEGDCIMWSRLAYAAVRADVLEQLESDGVDVNNPGAKCAGCDEDEPSNYDAEGRVWRCDDCETKRKSDAAWTDIEKLSRERVVELLNSASIECYDTETDNELRQALLENVMDETIDAEAVRS